MVTFNEKISVGNC